MDLRKLSSTTSLSSNHDAPEHTKTTSAEAEEVSQDNAAPDFAQIGQKFGIETAIGDDLDEEEGSAEEGAFLTEEEFYYSVVGMMELPNVALQFKGEEPLQSLTVTPDEEPKARKATDYLYKVAKRSPWLRWMVKPESETFQGIMAIGAFAVPKALAVRDELNQRRYAAHQAAKAANDNAGAHAQAG